MADKLFFAFRIATIPLLLAVVIFFEIERPFGSFRLATFAALFLLLADATSLLHGRVRDFLLVLTALAFGVVAIEATADELTPAPALKTSPGLSILQPTIGWGPQHAGQFHARKIDPKTGAVIYDVVYTIDSNLVRQTRSCATCATIAFFGDSYTFGEGLNDADTLPQALANNFDGKLRILNLAFSGYGPQHFLRELETGHFRKLIGSKPKLYVFLTLPYHAARTACKASWIGPAPHYALDNGQIVFKGPCRDKPSQDFWDWMEHTASFRMFVEPHLEKLNDADIDLYLRIVLASVRLAKEKYGVPTLIVYLDANDGCLRPPGFPRGEVEKRLRDGGAMVLDASLAGQAPRSELYIPDECHPSAAANRLRASLIEDYIKRHLSKILTEE